MCIPSNCRVAEAVPARQRSEVFTTFRVDHIEVDVQEVYVVDVETSESKVKCTNIDDNKREKFQFPDGSSFLLPTGLSLKGLETDLALKVALLVKDNLEAFSKRDFDLGLCDDIPHDIKLQDNTPIRQPYCRIPLNQLEEVKDPLQDKLDKNIIKKSVLLRYIFDPIVDVYDTTDTSGYRIGSITTQVIEDQEPLIAPQGKVM